MYSFFSFYAVGTIHNQYVMPFLFNSKRFVLLLYYLI